MQIQNQNNAQAQAEVVTISVLSSLLSKPTVPSKLTRLATPVPQKRKYKMVWVETVTYTEINRCAVCFLVECSHPERDITLEKHVTRHRKRQYLD